MPKKLSQSEIKELISGGAAEVVGEQEIAKKLRAGQKIRIKHGIDPTVATLHLGHAVNYVKMRRFQDAGHQIVIVIGDFTARIGDPTDKMNARAGLTPEQIKKNIKTWLDQIGRVLDMEKTEVVRNASWWGKMKLDDFLRIAKTVSATHLFERDMFQIRIKKDKPVWAHELIYPILQGYDSTQIRTDLTVIGHDQLFNELMARPFQREVGQDPQAVIAMPLLLGTDGKEKMSQSLNNFIGIAEEPAGQYGKVMSIPDSLMTSYFELLTAEPKATYTKLIKSDPKAAKMRLAHLIVAQMNSKKDADQAEQKFVNQFQKKAKPEDIREVKIPKKAMNAREMLTASGLCKSLSEAQRVIEEGGFSIDDRPVTDPFSKYKVMAGLVLKKGKRHYIRIK